MKNEEILAGLKNAVERGSTLDEAAKSFINAGYNPLDVKEAVNAMTSGGAFPLTSQKEQPQKTQLPIKENGIVVPKPEKPSSTSGKLVLLIVLLLILVAGGIVSLIFRDKIIGLFG